MKRLILTLGISMLALTACSEPEETITEPDNDPDVTENNSETETPADSEDEVTGNDESASGETEESDTRSPEDIIPSSIAALEPEIVDSSQAREILLSTTTDDVNMPNNTFFYYHMYMSDEYDEDHYIVNPESETTVLLTGSGGIIMVGILEYVDGEEDDLELLGTGEFLEEYAINTQYNTVITE